MQGCSIDQHILVHYLDIQLVEVQQLLVQVKVMGMELEQDQEPIDHSHSDIVMASNKHYHNVDYPLDIKSYHSSKHIEPDCNMQYHR